MKEAPRRPSATRFVHAGGGGQTPPSSEPLSPPIVQSSAFRFADARTAAAVHEGEEPGFFYGRMGTPTQSALEAAMAEIEGGEAALATGSGMSAIAIALLSTVGRGDHLVAQEALYTSTAALLEEIVEPLGVEVTRVDGTNSDEVVAALRPGTRAVYLETPANPRLGLADIRAIAAAARPVGAAVLVDSTFATPYNQTPLALGADLVVHSATKYLGGHGDLVAGVLVGRGDLLDEARWRWMRVLGPAIAPFVAWLVLRGLRTLPLRMARHNDSALEVARFLEADPRVDRVHYPGLESHPQHELARSQMSGFGGVVSFEVGGVGAGAEAAETARRLVDSVELCARAVSLGDVATLIQHAASMTQASLSDDDRSKTGVTGGLLRLSVGLEEPEDIIADLDRALERMSEERP